MPPAARFSSVPLAALLELTPIAAAALAVALWLCLASLARVGADSLYPLAIMLALAELWLALVFLVAGAGWFWLGRSAEGAAVLLSRLVFVVILYNRALDRWFNPDDGCSPCPRLGVAFFLPLVLALVIPLTSSAIIAITEAGGNRQARVR